MSEIPPADAAPPAAPETCARCERTLSESDRVPAGDRVFCRSCYETLRMELEQAVNAMSTGINYPMAAVGALLGGALGAAVWWGFTVLTHIAFGLIAVAIGFLAAHGAGRFAGNKRSGGLQLLAIGASILSFFAASYLVNMTFLNQELVRRGETWRLGVVPASVGQFLSVVSLGFGLMDLVFLAIVVYQAWSIPRPLKLPAPAAP